MRVNKVTKKQNLAPDPADDIFAVTPDDTKNLTINNVAGGTEVMGKIQARGGSGNIKVVTAADETRTIAFADKEILDVLVKKVFATDTETVNFTEGIFLYY